MVEIYDIVMLVIILGAALFGAVKGFAWQLASIVSIVASYVVAYRFREPFSQSIQADPPWNRFLAMLILFIGTSLVIWVAFRMISRTIDRLKLREFDRQVGFLFGGIKGFLYCSLITLFAVTLMGETIREKIVASKSGRFIAEVLDRSDVVIPAEIHVVIGPYLDRFDEKFSATRDSMDSYVNTQSPLPRETGSGGYFPWQNQQSARPDFQSNSQRSTFQQTPQQVPQNYQRQGSEQLPDQFWNQSQFQDPNQNFGQASPGYRQVPQQPGPANGSTFRGGGYQPTQPSAQQNQQPYYNGF